MKDKKIEDRFYLQIQREIDRIERHHNYHQGMYYVSRVSQIIFTGCITYLSGVKEPASYVTTILVLGTLTTALTAIETLFRFDTKKDIYSLLLFDLRSIRAEFIFHDIQENLSPDIRESLYKKYVTAHSSVRSLIEKVKTSKEKGDA